MLVKAPQALNIKLSIYLGEFQLIGDTVYMWFTNI